MTKKEIINIISANKVIKQNELLLSLTRNKNFNNIRLDKEYWFPQIEELTEEFKILEKEVQEALDESEECTKLIKSCNCPHHIRLKHYGVFGSHSTCVLCSESIVSDNCINWEYSVNRNKYCVDLIAKYQDDDDYGDIESGYTKEELYEIIIKILEQKDDDEEVDLVQEFKKINLKNCIITEKPIVKEKYILIINGTNKQFIDEESYIYKKTLNLGIEFLKYFSALLGTKVELLDSEKQNDELFKNYNNQFIQYKTLDELNDILSRQQNIPFEIIIDISEQYEYFIENDKINKKELDLNLEELFPNSKIIRIKNLSNKRKEEILNYLKSQLIITYAYQNKQYHSLENNKLKSVDFDTTCRTLKRMLIN